MGPSLPAGLGGRGPLGRKWAADPATDRPAAALTRRTMRHLPDPTLTDPVDRRVGHRTHPVPGSASRPLPADDSSTRTAPPSRPPESLEPRPPSRPRRGGLAGSCPIAGAPVRPDRPLGSRRSGLGSPSGGTFAARPGRRLLGLPRPDAGAGTRALHAREPPGASTGLGRPGLSFPGHRGLTDCLDDRQGWNVGACRSTPNSPTRPSSARWTMATGGSVSGRSVPARSRR
jgi:hypothetical protein